MRVLAYDGIKCSHIALLLDLQLLLRDFPLDPRVLCSIVDESSIVLDYQICSVARAQLHLFEALLFLFWFLLVLSGLVVFHFVGLDQLLRSLSLVEVVSPEMAETAGECSPSLEVSSQSVNVLAVGAVGLVFVSPYLHVLSERAAILEVALDSVLEEVLPGVLGGRCEYQEYSIGLVRGSFANFENLGLRLVGHAFGDVEEVPSPECA